MQAYRVVELVEETRRYMSDDRSDPLYGNGADLFRPGL
jgi:hypothetical protein